MQNKKTQKNKKETLRFGVRSNFIIFKFLIFLKISQLKKNGLEISPHFTVVVLRSFHKILTSSAKPGTSLPCLYILLFSGILY